MAPKVPLGILWLATVILDLLAIVFTSQVLRAARADSHGLMVFMSAVWSLAAALFIGRIFRDRRAGAVVGFLVFSHWVLGHRRAGGLGDVRRLLWGARRISARMIRCCRP